MKSRLTLLVPYIFLAGPSFFAADQTVVGAGNTLAERIAAESQLVQSAKQALLNNARGIQDLTLRATTVDAISNPATCVAHRIGVDDARKNGIVQSLLDAGLVNPADASTITGGVRAGVFPPILDEGTNCPHLPLSFNAAPGSAFGGHHSYPGGLPIHEANNDESFLNFADLYRGSYGDAGKELPEFGVLNFGGNGTNDAWGNAGDSRTGGHHIMSIAESMKRGLSPELVITQA